MTATDYGSISQRTAAWAAAEMLAHAEPVLVLSKFGASKPLPRNKADTVKFRRPIPFSTVAADHLLTEGVTPTAAQMQYEDVSVSLSQYGTLVEITDKVEDLSEDPVLKDAAMLTGEQAAEITENITWGVLRAGTNVGYSNGSARTDVNTALSLDDIRLATRTLRANRGKPITRILDSSPRWATRAVESGYVAVGHTDLEADIRDLPGFTPVAEYGSRVPLCPEELGTVENVRFVLSPVLDAFADAGGSPGSAVVSTSGSQADVYPLIVFAREAFGLVPLKGANAIEPTVINPGVKSKSDPLGQRGYVGSKFWFASLILNEAWAYRIECGASDLV